jgi:hypothetical protein
MAQFDLNNVRCEALFASMLQPSDVADRVRVSATILAVVRQFGSQGCSERVAQEFGDHPETAIARMQWAREMVTSMYGLDPCPADGRPKLGTEATPAAGWCV